MPSHSYVPHPREERTGKVQLKSLFFAFTSNAGYQKNNPFVGLIFAFRDEDKRLSQTDCTGGGYQKNHNNTDSPPHIREDDG